MADWASLGMSAGQQYVISWDQYTTDINLCADAGFYSRNGSGTFNFHDGRSYGSAKNTLLNTWQRVYYTFTVNATRNLNDSYGSIYMYGHTTSNSGGTLKIANVQLELGVSVPSPYVDHTSAGLSSTRSSTQGLLPLVGNSTIDLSNVSFDSNAQIAFDGTNDYMVTSTVIPCNFGTGDFTAEVVIYPQSFASYTHMVALPNQSTFALKANISDGAIYYYDPAFSTYGSTSGWTLTLNQWNHVVLVRSGNIAYAYLNGVSKGSKTGFNTNFSSTQIVNVGNGGTSEYTQKKIDVVKIYNRALSAAEVRQNYLHYKTRFNLS
jgi:hypothetical protein